jgi:hypothetical protein
LIPKRADSTLDLLDALFPNLSKKKNHANLTQDRNSNKKTLPAEAASTTVAVLSLATTSSWWHEFAAIATYTPNPAHMMTRNVSLQKWIVLNR